jgi:hypothetical protein
VCPVSIAFPVLTITKASPFRGKTGLLLFTCYHLSLSLSLGFDRFGPLYSDRLSKADSDSHSAVDKSAHALSQLGLRLR